MEETALVCKIIYSYKNPYKLFGEDWRCLSITLINVALFCFPAVSVIIILVPSGIWKREERKRKCVSPYGVCVLQEDGQCTYNVTFVWTCCSGKATVRSLCIVELRVFCQQYKKRCLHVKILSDFNQIWSLSTDFRSKSTIWHFTEIRPVEAALIQKHGRTGGCEANVRFT